MERQETIAFSDEEDNNCWGKLVSLTSKIPNKNLTSNEYTLGRSATNAIVIQDKRLSGTHTKICKEGGKVYVYDLSTNGTYFEDDKLGKNEKRELLPGSKFYLLHPSKVNEDDVIGYIFALPGTDPSSHKRTREENGNGSSSHINNQTNELLKKQQKLVDDLGEEMQCSICIDYVYQCVTLVPCLHNFCGGCFSDWVKKNDVCPQCREEVKEVKKNATLNNLTEKFLEAHPEKKRSTAEYQALDKLNKFTQDRTILKADTKSNASKKKKDGEEEKDDPTMCLECKTARRDDGFKCDRNNKAHLNCTSCKKLFPDRRDAHSQECSICNAPYCNLYWRCTGGRRDRLEELQNHDVPPNLLDTCFRGNKYEVKVLRDFMFTKKMTCKNLLQEFLKDVADKGNFKYKANKSILATAPAVNFEVTLQRKSPVCMRCFDFVWFQILFRYRESIKSQLPQNVQSRPKCWYGLNCKTMIHNDDHSKKLDHICEQTKF